MANIYEHSLIQKSSIESSDKIRIVGSDDRSYSNPPDDFGAYISETYANSSLLGVNQSISSALTQIQNGIDLVDNMIGLASEVATVAEMVDQTKVYIYNGTEEGYIVGHWYYYSSDSQAWVDGGEPGLSNLMNTVEQYLISHGLVVDDSGDLHISGNYYNSNGKIGERLLAEPDSVSCGSGRYYKLAQITIPPTDDGSSENQGYWLITVATKFLSAALVSGGERKAYITLDDFTDGTSTAPTSFAQSLYAIDGRPGASSSEYLHQVDCILHVSGIIKEGISPTTLTLVGYQDSGSSAISMDVTGRINAVRLS